MSQMHDFLILRELDEPITHEDLDGAAAKSGETLEAMRSEGTEIGWVDSEVLTNEDDQVVGTFCHYQAESGDESNPPGDPARGRVIPRTTRGAAV
jgi:hypothetical protein